MPFSRNMRNLLSFKKKRPKMPPALPNGNFAFVGPLRTKKRRGGVKNFGKKDTRAFFRSASDKKAKRRVKKNSDTKKDTR